MSEGNHSKPKLSLIWVEKIALEHYGIKAHAIPLDGEIDFNFALSIRNNRKYVIKFTPADDAAELLDFQEKILTHLENSSISLAVPRVLPTLHHQKYWLVNGPDSDCFYCRVFHWIEGDLWADIPFKSPMLYTALGKAAGSITHALSGFEHTYAIRTFDWNLDQACWVEKYLHLLDTDDQEIANDVIIKYKKIQYNFQQCRKSVIHNDINDRNIIAGNQSLAPEITGIIDFGDAVKAASINDLAVTITYAIMDAKDPLSAAACIVRGYHQNFNLYGTELKYLHLLVSVRLVISLTKSAINRISKPENAYLQISDTGAKKLLHYWSSIDQNLAYFTFRHAAGLQAHPEEKKFSELTGTLAFNLTDIFPALIQTSLCFPDMSVGSPLLGHRQEYDDLMVFEKKLSDWASNFPNTIPANGYLEIRPFYSTDAYKKEGNNGPEYRTVHLGVDFWVSAGTALHTPIDGVVFSVYNNSGFKDYGPTVILEHEVESIKFYTLYGHLSVNTLDRLQIGQRLKKGMLLGFIGNPTENGNWEPHLHFQIMLDLLGNQFDFPGVCYPAEVSVYKSICPDPLKLIPSADAPWHSLLNSDDLMSRRKRYLGKSLSLSYNDPLHMVRGDGLYLIDSIGRKYMDTVNNVAHVGHEHFRIVNKLREQASLLNTNTRYLHENIVTLCESLITVLPSHLKVAYFVNSGSEANELALKMAKTITGQRDIVALESGYHGNTNTCIDISAYKFYGKGGQGKPDNTHLISLNSLQEANNKKITSLTSELITVEEILPYFDQINKKPAAFIHETIVSCGGQIELGSDKIKNVYRGIKSMGGLCIADEVQTGFGRVGSHWWAFELHGLSPDIVTMGKSMGNGHPVAAVVCTQEVADAFANGMEYFNTYGGNPVSCAIANEVMDIIISEKLMQNALQTGNYLLSKLNGLQDEFPIIADVRGKGLFLGIEFTDIEHRALTEYAKYVSNRMKECGILTSTDGPHNNVIKIKPPMCFNHSDADEYLYRLKKILQEVTRIHVVK